MFKAIIAIQIEQQLPSFGHVKTNELAYGCRYVPIEMVLLLLSHVVRHWWDQGLKRKQAQLRYFHVVGFTKQK